MESVNEALSAVAEVETKVAYRPPAVLAALAVVCGVVIAGLTWGNWYIIGIAGAVLILGFVLSRPKLNRGMRDSLRQDPRLDHWPNGGLSWVYFVAPYPVMLVAQALPSSPWWIGVISGIVGAALSWWWMLNLDRAGRL